MFSREVLAPGLTEIAAIAVMTARGTMAPQLLDVGVTRGEIVEVLMQMAVYAGFPAALNGIAAVKEVLGI